MSPPTVGRNSIGSHPARRVEDFEHRSVGGGHRVSFLFWCVWKGPGEKREAFEQWLNGPKMVGRLVLLNVYTPHH